MFTTVAVPCPNCTEYVYLQSHGLVYVHPGDPIPASQANEVKGLKGACKGCGTQFKSYLGDVYIAPMKAVKVKLRRVPVKLTPLERLIRNSYNR